MGKMRRRRLRDLSIVQNTPNSEEANSEQQIVVGSSNVPETLNEPLKVVGRAEVEDRVKVSRNNHGQPVGSEARLLAGYLDIISRNANMLPINYESWHHIPDSNKNQSLNNIKERFALKVSDDCIKKALGKKWKDHKSTLKKLYFKKDISLEEKLRNVPLGMLRTVSELEQAADKNKIHAHGREVSSGQKVGRLQLFEITHRKKDGSPMTSKAGEIMEKLKEKKAEYEALLRLIVLLILRTLITELSLKFWVLKGTVGFDFKDLVLPRPNILDSAPSNTCLPGVKLKLKFRELQQQLRAEAAEKEAAAAAREAEQSRKYDELQLQLQHMMQMFQQSQKPPS
ncbi:hypothetical protein GOBAR_AA12169 [Gossypium barbadense]|uniref:Transposase Tnp1/En/Spm-like domain-containing protein n=1 Tax=Gossypium barbadense TaxID=3634 RepID=A0A2P5XYP9_GOSBA|nr:hypothetical protein GOBAR_AA12169 [Gossypium barbadense]